METITVWTDSPEAQERLRASSPLARDAFGIYPPCPGLILDNFFVLGRIRRAPKSLFDEVHSLALTGRR